MFLRSKRVGFYGGILKNLKNRKLNFIFNAPTMYFTGKLRLYGVPFSSFQPTGISKSKDSRVEETACSCPYFLCCSRGDVCVVVQFYPWFKFSFLLFQTHYHVIIIHYHTQKQKERKFEPRIKLNHNICIHAMSRG